jgi:hypothetical protein
MNICAGQLNCRAQIAVQMSKMSQILDSVQQGGIL